MTLSLVLAPEAEDDLGVGTAFLHRFPYGVRFRLLDDRIEIVAVWHERSDPEGWTERVADES